MPIVYNREFATGRVALWKVTESLCELMDSLTEAEVSYVKGLKSEARQVESAAWRVLARALTCGSEIVYDGVKAPCFADKTKGYIGVSHTVGYVAVIISEGKPCAVDIEKAERNVQRVKSRYISENEDFLRSGKSFDLALWCAKEVAFKYVRAEGVDFLKDIVLVDYDNSKINMHSDNPENVNSLGVMSLVVQQTVELKVAVEEFSELIVAYSIT